MVQLSPSGRPFDRPPAVIELTAADKVFDDGVRGLDPISLVVDAGEFVTIIGPSGCGKSTLLKLVARLHDLSSGRIRWWGDDFERVGSPGRRLAFVFQDPTLMPWANVATNVRLPLDLAHVSRAEADARTGQALAQVELGARANAMPRQLSGGMRMRVSIARALVTAPDLLLMDEPFAALDELTRNRLDEDLAALSFVRGLTTMFVTHSIYEAVFLSTRILVMAAPGRVFAEYEVDAPRPRDDAFRLSDRFAVLCRELSRLLREAALASGSVA